MEEKEKNGEKKKVDENSGHYVIASSVPPERRPLEHRTLMPKQHQNNAYDAHHWRRLPNSVDVSKSSKRILALSLGWLQSYSNEVIDDSF